MLTIDHKLINFRLIGTQIGRIFSKMFSFLVHLINLVLHADFSCFSASLLEKICVYLSTFKDQWLRRQRHRERRAQRYFKDYLLTRKSPVIIHLYRNIKNICTVCKGVQDAGEKKLYEGLGAGISSHPLLTILHSH